MSALGTVECRIDDVTGNLITVYLAEQCIIRCVSNIMSFFFLSVNSIIIVKEFMCVYKSCV